MSNAPRLTRNLAQDTTPSAELNALAIIYRRAVERYEENQAAAHAPDNGLDDAKESDNDCAATKNHSR